MNPELPPPVNKLHGALNKYISIENRVFSVALFQPIDYGSLRQELVTIRGELQEVRDAATTLHPSGTATDARGVVLVRMLEYRDALDAAIGRLADICGRLALVSANAGEYDNREYKRDIDDYRASVQQYRAMGDRLNQALRATQ